MGNICKMPAATQITQAPSTQEKWNSAREWKERERKREKIVVWNAYIKRLGCFDKNTNSKLHFNLRHLSIDCFFTSFTHFEYIYCIRTQATHCGALGEHRVYEMFVYKYKSISRPTIYRLYRRVMQRIDIWFQFTSVIWYFCLHRTFRTFRTFMHTIYLQSKAINDAVYIFFGW